MVFVATIFVSISTQISNIVDAVLILAISIKNALMEFVNVRKIGAFAIIIVSIPKPTKAIVVVVAIDAMTTKNVKMLNVSAPTI